MFTITSIGISNSNHRYIGLSNLNIIRFIFFLSLRGERCFFRSSVFRQVPKTCFFYFLLVGKCRSVVSEVFWLSAGADDLFFRFLPRRRVPTTVFLNLLLVGGCRSVVFYVFISSEALEEDVYHKITLTECAARRLCATIFRVTN